MNGPTAETVSIPDVPLERRRGGRAGAAAGFVDAGGANRDALFGFKGALRVVRSLTTLHADGVGLGDVFGDGEELGHWLPGLSGVILIEADDDDEADDDYANAALRYFRSSILPLFLVASGGVNPILIVDPS